MRTKLPWLTAVLLLAAGGAVIAGVAGGCRSADWVDWAGSVPGDFGR